jgi:hypothetical protein
VPALSAIVGCVRGAEIFSSVAGQTWLCRHFFAT